jgi:hypothetical protein
MRKTWQDLSLLCLLSSASINHSHASQDQVILLQGVSQEGTILDIHASHPSCEAVAWIFGSGKFINHFLLSGGLELGMNLILIFHNEKSTNQGPGPCALLPPVLFLLVESMYPYPLQTYLESTHLHSDHVALNVLQGSLESVSVLLQMWPLSSVP